jgi:Fic family protein
MKWNWQQKNWPEFRYDKAVMDRLEEKFIHRSGILLGAFKHISNEDKQALTINLISEEALKTSEIEGEYLSRDSLQSSVRRQFGLKTDDRNIPQAEQGIAEMMVDLYRNFEASLTNKLLFTWHQAVLSGRRDVTDVGCYRTHDEPMQVVSGALHKPKIHFEAPPSATVAQEMATFISWFKASAPGGSSPLPPLALAGIAHLYFVSIHPFEDGNGRVARAISEKALSQCVGQPTLIALSQTIHGKRKAYYYALEQNNKSMEISDWVLYFGEAILEAQVRTETLFEFLIEKTKFFDRFRGQFNPRQEKTILRMFHEGPDGFRGGLSAKNYIAITGAARATATRDLQDLVDKGALTRTGERKSTRYRLNIVKNEPL